MIQIFDILTVFTLILLAGRLLHIKMDNISAAIAVAFIAVVEICIASSSSIFSSSVLFFWLVILFFNPLLEEFVRVRFSPNSNNSSRNYFSTSLMIGSLEAITKTFTFANKFSPESYVDHLNAYILLSATLSILIHISLGLVLLSFKILNFFQKLVLMTIVHSTYNFLFVFTEPQDLVNKNIQLSVVVFICMFYLYYKKSIILSGRDIAPIQSS